ncbi:hypothetical protein SDC9_123495 [bioreactor metagenome]|uniref:Uncharacterized protein n=1 Tax=bioreactor metagenome TaxID=1076179 RepID=A0A645CHR6_9ZZZZ
MSVEFLFPDSFSIGRQPEFTIPEKGFGGVGIHNIRKSCCICVPVAHAAIAKKHIIVTEKIYAL